MQKAASSNSPRAQPGAAGAARGVSLLTELLAGQNADLNEIAKVISRNPDLRAELLRVANPGKDHEAEYEIDTVEGALLRNGVGCVLLLAMSGPLGRALAKTFQTMLARELKPVGRGTVPALEGQHLLGIIDFTGKAEGQVCLRTTLDSGSEIAATLLGVPAAELGHGPEIDDAVGEVLNIMTGNFKSFLCDSGLGCRLQPPVVKRSSNLVTPVIRGGGLQRLVFKSGAIALFVDITVNPWNDA